MFPYTFKKKTTSYWTVIAFRLLAIIDILEA